MAMKYNIIFPKWKFTLNCSRVHLAWQLFHSFLPGQGRLLGACARFRQLTSVPLDFSWRDVIHEAESGPRSVAGTDEILHPFSTRV